MIVFSLGCSGSGIKNSKNLNVEDIVLNLVFETGADPYDSECYNCTQSTAGNTALSVDFYLFDEDAWCLMPEDSSQSSH